MFLTNEQANERLNSSNNLANRFGRNIPAPSPVQKAEEIEDDKFEEPLEGESTEAAGIKLVTLHRPGRKQNSDTLSTEQITEIALRARSGEDQKDVAKDFGVTRQNVSYIEKGASKSVDNDLIDSQLTKISNAAIERLAATFGLLTDEKIAKASAKDISTIARNLSGVVQTIRNPQQTQTPVNVNIYTPELRSERSFRTVEIGG